MIGPPINDHPCLGGITERIVTMVANRDPAFVELASRYPTTDLLVAYLRGLPQRDDLGRADDGPRVEECTPSQRLNLDLVAPNCVERTTAFLIIEELRDPRPLRQLMTVQTPDGLHVLPFVDGRPVFLDPGLPPDCVDCGLVLACEGPIAVEPRNAIAWTTTLAASEAAPWRNGASAVHRARNAMERLVDHHILPREDEIDAMGLLFALASRAARRFGPRAVGIVATTMRAMAKILDNAIAAQGIAEQPRNLSFGIGDLHLSSPPWLDHVVSALAGTGVDIGSTVARDQLKRFGIGADLIGLAESNFNREGLTLGAFAHPPELATFARFAAPRTA